MPDAIKMSKKRMSWSWFRYLSSPFSATAVQSQSKSPLVYCGQMDAYGMLTLVLAAADCGGLIGTVNFQGTDIARDASSGLEYNLGEGLGSKMHSSSHWRSMDMRS